MRRSVALQLGLDRVHLAQILCRHRCQSWRVSSRSRTGTDIGVDLGECRPSRTAKLTFGDGTRRLGARLLGAILVPTLFASLTLSRPSCFGATFVPTIFIVIAISLDSFFQPSTTPTASTTTMPRGNRVERIRETNAARRGREQVPAEHRRRRGVLSPWQRPC